MEKDTIVGKVSNCPLFCFCKRILLTPTYRQKLLSHPQTPLFFFFPLFKDRISRAEAALQLRASDTSLNKSLCREIPRYSHIPSTSCCNRFLFQTLPSRVAGQGSTATHRLIPQVTHQTRQATCLSLRGSSSVGLSYA